MLLKRFLQLIDFPSERSSGLVVSFENVVDRTLSSFGWNILPGWSKLFGIDDRPQIRVRKDLMTEYFHLVFCGSIYSDQFSHSEKGLESTKFKVAVLEHKVGVNVSSADFEFLF